MYYLILFRAYELLPAQEAQVLNFTWPIVMTLLAVIILKQSLRWTNMLSILMSFMGVVIVATHGDILAMQFSNETGVILALLSTVIWSVFWLLNKKDTQAPLPRLMMNFVFGVLWIALITSVAQQWQWPSANAMLGVVYIGLFEMSLAFFFWLLAMRLAENISAINNLVFLTPFASLLVIHWVLKEAIYPSTLLGLVIICASILFQRMMSKRQGI